MTAQRTTKDLLIGLVLLALALAMLGWLVVDLSAERPVGGLMVVARLASVAFWLGLAWLAVSDGHGLTGVAVAGGSVVLLLVAMAAGLLLTPDDFVSTTSKGPTTPEAARRLGVVLTVVLVLGGGWLWRRARRPTRVGSR